MTRAFGFAFTIAFGFTLAFAFVVVGCTHPTSTITEHDDHETARDALSQFSSSLAHEGMSVPLPARICDEDGDVLRWRDDPGCVELKRGEAFNERAVVAVYAVAIAKDRFPSSGGDASLKAEAILRAYFAHDDASLAKLALAFESEFDAARSKRPTKPERVVHREVAHENVVDAGPAVAHAPTHEVLDAGTLAEHTERVATVDAGPAPLSTRDKLVGTWTYEGGPIRNVYALCGDGKYDVRFEVVDPSFDFALDDLPTVHGSWTVVDGDPPKITFTSQGESVDAPVTKIDDDAIDVTIDSEELHLTRRAKTAACD